MESTASSRDESLSRYFQDLSNLKPMTGKEGFQIAKDLERLEISLWSVILSNPLLLAPIREAVAQALPELTIRTKDPKKIAAKIRAADVDRKALRAVLALVRQRKGTWPRRVENALAAADRCRDRFVRGNLRLVINVVKRFRHQSFSISDLIQEGNIGLMKAVGRYEYRRGYCFSTYAIWWIRASITRALLDRGREVRLPVGVAERWSKIRQAKHSLENELGRAATVEELATETRLAPKAIEKALEHAPAATVPLDYPEGLEVEDQAPTATEGLISHEQAKQIREILHHLTPTEAAVIRQRFGFDGEGSTLQEIGDRWHLSRERIRQIEKKALTKLRRALAGT